MRQKKKRAAKVPREQMTEQELKALHEKLAAEGKPLPSDGDSMLDQSVYSYYTEKTDLNESILAASNEMASPDKRGKTQAANVQILAELEESTMPVDLKPMGSEEKKHNDSVEVLSMENPSSGDGSARPHAKIVKTDGSAPLSVRQNTDPGKLEATEVVEQPKASQMSITPVREAANKEEQTTPATASATQETSPVEKEEKKEEEQSTATPTVETEKKSSPSVKEEVVQSAKPEKKVEKKPVVKSVEKADDVAIPDQKVQTTKKEETKVDVSAPVAAKASAPVTAPVATPVTAKAPAPVAAKVPAPVAAKAPAPVAAKAPTPVAAPVSAPAVKKEEKTEKKVEAPVSKETTKPEEVKPVQQSKKEKVEVKTPAKTETPAPAPSTKQNEVVVEQPAPEEPKKDNTMLLVGATAACAILAAGAYLLFRRK